MQKLVNEFKKVFLLKKVIELKKDYPDQIFESAWPCSCSTEFSAIKKILKA